METPEPPLGKERLRRLALLADALENQLAPDWIYVLVIGKPDDRESVNLISNGPPEVAEALVELMSERRRKGKQLRSLPDPEEL